MGFQMPDFDESNMSDMDDDAYEAELRQIQEGIGIHAAKRSKTNQKKSSKFYLHDIQWIMTL